MTPKLTEVFVIVENETTTEDGLLKAIVNACDAIDPGSLFGTRKAFIEDVWTELTLGQDYPYSRLSLPELKTKLIELHRKGKVELARADLIPAKFHETSIESEIKHHEARYHVIVMNWKKDAW